MKKLLSAAMLLVGSIAVISAFGIQFVLAVTDDLQGADTPTLALDSPIGGEGQDEQFDVDRLRELCKVPWPASIAGDRTEEARRKACRAFGE